MDDEYSSLWDPEMLVLQAFIYRTGEAILAPARKTISAGRHVLRFFSGILQDAQNAIIAQSIYDLNYQHEKSLEKQ